MKVIKIHNNITNINYIGLFEDDEINHYTNPILKRAVNIYYPENFTEEVLLEGENNMAEEYYNNYKINNRVIYSPNFYNIPETEEEKKQYKDYINKLNKEEYKNWRKDHIYIYQTAEFRSKMSARKKGELNPMYGKKHTEKTKKLMSQNRKGLTVGEKNGNYGNKGEKAKNSKPIYKYKDKEHTELICKYNTLELALNDLGLKGHSKLYEAIKENTEYKGFYWSK